MSKKKKELDLKQAAPGSPIGVTVIDGNLNSALRTFKKLYKDSKMKRILVENKEYKKPSLKRREELLSAKHRNKLN